MAFEHYLRGVERYRISVPGAERGMSRVESGWVCVWTGALVMDGPLCVGQSTRDLHQKPPWSPVRSRARHEINDL